MHYTRDTNRRTAPVDQTRKVGEFVPPRKLLKKVGDIEMWQVETPGPRGRNITLVQYEVCGATCSTVVFSRPNLALEHFHQLSTGAAANG